MAGGVGAKADKSGDCLAAPDGIRVVQRPDEAADGAPFAQMSKGYHRSQSNVRVGPGSRCVAQRFDGACVMQAHHRVRPAGEGVTDRRPNESLARGVQCPCRCIREVLVAKDGDERIAGTRIRDLAERRDCPRRRPRVGAGDGHDQGFDGPSAQ